MIYQKDYNAGYAAGAKRAKLDMRGDTEPFDGTPRDGKSGDWEEGFRNGYDDACIPVDF